MLRLFAVLLATAYVAAPATAQSDDLDWGRIPDEDIALATYAPDTNAVALVLGDEGRVRFRRNANVTLERHRRVKVFTPAGYDVATVSLVYRPSSQDLRKVQGQTFVRGADGRTRRVKLDGDEIFEEDLEGGLRRVRFTLPGLAPGAVFEYRYTLESESPFLFPDWTFQGTIPTRWSAFEAEVPRYFEYVRFVQGNPAFAVEEIREEPLDLDEMRREAGFTVNPHRPGRLRAGAISANEKRYETHVNTYRWVAEDVPALTEEPYVTTIDDYFQRIEFQFAAYYDEYGIPKPVLRSWEELAEELRDHDDFGREIQPSGDVRRQADALGLDTLNAAARAVAVYDFVRKGIAWDERYTVFADDDVDDVLEQKRGSSAEVNLLLTALLRAAGVDAFPVLVSTRSHGQVLLAYPQYSQFNHVVTLVLAGGQGFLLDATDPFRPAGVLPTDALNGSGWLVTDDAQRWIGIAPTAQTGTTIFIDGALSADGTLRGELSARLVGYAAFDVRKELEEGGDATDEAFDETPAALTFSDVDVDGADDDGALTVRATFEEPGRGQAIAHLLTFNPIALDAFDENPLSRPERTYPVDFAYPYTASYNADIALPAGYAVDELPEPVTASLPENAARYRRTFEMKDGKLRVQRQLTVGRARFEPEEYDALRAFFADVVAGDAATVVLVKADGASSDAGDAEAGDVGG